MTISADRSRVVHVANGTATFFSSSPIEGLDATNIKVTTISTTGTETVRVLGVDYTITTGGITFASPPANGTSVVIQRIVPLLQPDQYLVNAPFPARVTESRFDQVVMGLQQLSDELGRTLRVSIGEGTFTALLPRPAQRANRLLGFDAAGAPVAVTGNQISNVLITPFGEALLTAVDAAEGRTVLGAAASADVNARLPIDGSQPMTGPLRIVPGTAAAPGLAVDGDADTGLHRPAADTVALTTGGTTRLTVGTSAITAAVPVVLPADPTADMQAAPKQYVDTAVAGAGKLRSVFFTQTSTTWTPANGTNFYLMLAIGGGGGGGNTTNAPYGGGAGARVWRIYAEALSGNITVTVGAGGVGGTHGNPGGDTIIGSTLLKASGGQGGHQRSSLMTYGRPDVTQDWSQWQSLAPRILANQANYVGEGNNTSTSAAAGYGWGVGGNSNTTTSSGGPGAAGAVMILEFAL